MRVFTLACTCAAVMGSAFGQDLNGTWKGDIKSTGVPGHMELTLSSGTPSARVVVTPAGNQAESADGVVQTKDDGTIKIDAKFGQLPISFLAVLKEQKLLGTYEMMNGGQRVFAASFCLTRSADVKCTDADFPALLPIVAPPGQTGDSSFDTTVANPAYTNKHPKLLFDEGHRNFHTTTGTYKAFASLATNDGYEVVVNKKPFTPASLEGFNMLAMANARGTKSGESAFTDEEIEVVAKWVENGGSLLLIADHAPAGGYAKKLSARFGVDMSTGVTDDPKNLDPVLRNMVFSRDNKLLANHPITRGRAKSERINKVVSFTGQSLKSSSGDAILLLSDSAFDLMPNSDTKVSAAGRSQAVALKFGRGRVVVVGEAAMMTAELLGDGTKFGMNAPGTDDRQFVLNVLHWLSGLLK